MKYKKKHKITKIQKDEDSPSVICSTGWDRLWCWFGLSHATWVTLPRVMCQQMSDEWQFKMAELLEEWDKTWVNQPDIGTRVQVTKEKRLCKTPEWLVNYRHPNKRIFDAMKVVDGRFDRTPKEADRESIDTPFKSATKNGQR